MNGTISSVQCIQIPCPCLRHVYNDLQFTISSIRFPLLSVLKMQSGLWITPRGAHREETEMEETRLFNCCGIKAYKSRLALFQCMHKAYSSSKKHTHERHTFWSKVYEKASQSHRKQVEILKSDCIQHFYRSNIHWILDPDWLSYIYLSKGAFDARVIFKSWKIEQEQEP